MSRHIQTYNSATGEEEIRTPKSAADLLGNELSIPNKLIDAHKAEMLAKQYVSRVHRNATGGLTFSTPIAMNILTPLVFATETAEVNGWRRRVVNGVTGLVDFICSENGWYNFKMSWIASVSIPAVALLDLTDVRLYYQVVRHRDSPWGNYFPQFPVTDIPLAREYAQYTQAPQVNFLRGWHLSGADKVPLFAGDEITFKILFNGLNPSAVLGFFDDWDTHCAISKVAEFLPNNNCCEN